MFNILCSTEAVKKCSEEYAANLLENTHAEE